MTDNKTCDAVFKFETAEQREMFILWLCEQGEQDYWEWMKYSSAPDKDTVDIGTKLENSLVGQMTMKMP